VPGSAGGGFRGVLSGCAASSRCPAKQESPPCAAITSGIPKHEVVLAQLLGLGQPGQLRGGNHLSEASRAGEPTPTSRHGVDTVHLPVNSTHCCPCCSAAVDRSIGNQMRARPRCASHAMGRGRVACQEDDAPVCVGAGWNGCPLPAYLTQAGWQPLLCV